MGSRVPRILKVAARLSSLLFALLVIVMFVAPDPYRVDRALRPDEIVGMVFFPWGMLAGSLIGWRWPRAGGLLAVGSLPALYLSTWAFGAGWPFSIFHLLATLPGVLFLALSSVERRPPSAQGLR